LTDDSVDLFVERARDRGHVVDDVDRGVLIEICRRLDGSIRRSLESLEAEERAQRAVSQAQLTKAGHVYVISNIGSFGNGVFKIGMTRRLEPMERV
jgi:hypothetical protein